jgi:hypothetical protein
MASEDYYRTIAAEFLQRRGGPLFLAPKDIALIAAWEERGVPLRVVLEGLERAFEYRKRKSLRTRGVPLTWCERFVESAFAQHRDRQAGAPHRARPRAEKAGRARAAVRTFLAAGGAAEPRLTGLLEEALEKLGAAAVDEARLEAIDDEVDRLLWEKAEPERVEALKREARRHGGAPDGGPDPAAYARTMAVKEMREKMKVPYVSLFYY